VKNTLINRAVTKRIASALGELNSQVVYVGGAIVSLYIDDPAADDVRPTKDIDISMEIASVGELEEIRVSLNEKGFHQSHQDDVLCRFRYEDILVDVMATQAIGWAPANPWFASGFKKKQACQIDDMEIHILPLPYFLATKYSAFNGRGRKDPRTSHDFEDIVYLLNYTSSLTEQVTKSDKEVKAYLQECANEILNSDILQEAILGNLYYEEHTTRFSKVINDLKIISDGI
jgi:predicted nucleotidyltransferase